MAAKSLRQAAMSTMGTVVTKEEYTGLMWFLRIDWTSLEPVDELMVEWSSVEAMNRRTCSRHWKQSSS